MGRSIFLTVSETECVMVLYKFFNALFASARICDIMKSSARDRVFCVFRGKQLRISDSPPDPIKLLSTSLYQRFLSPPDPIKLTFTSSYKRNSLACYGLTETAAIVASMFTKEETERYGSSGLLAPNVDGKIVDPDTGRVAPAELEALLLAHPEIADAAKSLSKLNIDFAQPKQQVYSKSLRPSFVTVRAMSESQTALKNQPQSSASSGKKQALISLSDKNASTLENAGVSVTSKVETLTHFPEMASFILYLVLDGRVKSLHPNIHGGILAGRDVDHHMEALNEHGIDMSLDI
ncbi:hypothetical protein YC2023_110281 [Brassica napus]